MQGAVLRGILHTQSIACAVAWVSTLIRFSRRMLFVQVVRGFR